MTDKPGGRKFDTGKADLSLIPMVALETEARAFMVGEIKYGRYNYYQGLSASRLVAAMLRHAVAWNEGEECDPVDGQNHLGSVRACAAMLLKCQELGTLEDDRYKDNRLKVLDKFFGTPEGEGLVKAQEEEDRNKEKKKRLARWKAEGMADGKEEEEFGQCD